MIRIGDQVFRDHGVAPTWFVKLFARDPGAARRLRHLRRQTADGRHCLHRQHRRPGGADQGYGKDDAVNGMIAAFLVAGSSPQGWLVEFESVPSKANVADAVSRDDFGRVLAEGWTRVGTSSRSSRRRRRAWSTPPPTRRTSCSTWHRAFTSEPVRGGESVHGGCRMRPGTGCSF